MSSEFPTRQTGAATKAMVGFGRRSAIPDRFNVLFREGMGLVERATAYLEGEGRQQARRLPSPLSVVYTSESMRLTTRLLEMASWLLIQRKLMTGQLTAEEARQKRRRIDLRPLGRTSPPPCYDELPAGLRQLIEAGAVLNDRIVQLDRILHTPETGCESVPVNPVAAQHARLRAAFGNR
ncbi:MAG: DUF1465 family protein [Hyphomicrobiaceae bacterium]